MLVVTHEATRTGAPKVALQLVEALRAAGWETVAVLRWRGPLRPDFHEVADSVVDEPLSRFRALLYRRRRTRQLVPTVSRLAADWVVRWQRPDLVWCNTVISAPYAVAAARRGVPSVVLSHEHEALVNRSVETSRFHEALGSTRAAPVLLGCAPATAELFERIVGAPRGSVGTVCSSIDVAAVRGRVSRPHDVPAGPLVVGCGVANAYKGVDVFAEAARKHAADGGTATWCWVGRIDERPPGADDVLFVGERDDATSWIAAASVFVLPSRQDAFPLVVLEAMALARPIVASDLPGPADQLGGAGMLVPVGDAAALRRAVEDLLADPQRAAAIGAAAAARCEELWDERHFHRRVAEIADELVPA